MGRFIKKEEEKSFDKEKIDEIKKSQPVWDTKRKLVFVNGSKFKRAQEIIALIKGERGLNKQEDFDRKEHFSRQLEAHNVDIQSEDAVPALYEILGGLIRTPNEQKEVDEKAKEMRAKGKKDKMGIK